MQNENGLRELSDSIKCNNTCIIGVPEEEREKGKNLFEEIIAENFPNLEKKTNILMERPKVTVERQETQKQ